MPDIPAEFLTEPRATERQVKFIQDLLDQRDLFKSPKWFDAVNAMDKDEYVAYLNRVKAELVPKLTKSEASKWIDALLALPNVGQATVQAYDAMQRAGERGNFDEVERLAAQQTDAEVKRLGSLEKVAGVPDIPDGRYALEFAEDDLNPVRFYRVKRGKDYTARGGRDWTNFLFVTRFSSDEEFNVKGADRTAVLKRIAADPREAAIRFGREENACCICGRRLTRRLSRELGIGPVCGGRQAWFDQAYINAARERLAAAGYDPDEEVT